MKRKERLALERAEREAEKAIPCPGCGAAMKIWQDSAWCPAYMKAIKAMDNIHRPNHPCSGVYTIGE